MFCPSITEDKNPIACADNFTLADLIGFIHRNFSKFYSAYIIITYIKKRESSKEDWLNFDVTLRVLSESDFNDLSWDELMNIYSTLQNYGKNIDHTVLDKLALGQVWTISDGLPAVAGTKVPKSKIASETVSQFTSPAPDLDYPALLAMSSEKQTAYILEKIKNRYSPFRMDGVGSDCVSSSFSINHPVEVYHSPFQSTNDVLYCCRIFSLAEFVGKLHQMKKYADDIYVIVSNVKKGTTGSSEGVIPAMVYFRTVSQSELERLRFADLYEIYTLLLNNEKIINLSSLNSGQDFNFK
jgi:hypothetical protein